MPCDGDYITTPPPPRIHPGYILGGSSVYFRKIRYILGTNLYLSNWYLLGSLLGVFNSHRVSYMYFTKLSLKYKYFKYYNRKEKEHYDLVRRELEWFLEDCVINNYKVTATYYLVTFINSDHWQRNHHRDAKLILKNIMRFLKLNFEARKMI